MKKIIGIYNLDSKNLNIALEKIKKYYIRKKFIVETYQELKRNLYHKVFVSSIFSFTKKPDKYRNFITGGSGYNIKSKLPEDIEKLKIYKNYGFTSRGCNRICKFCIVHKKEGTFHPTGDILDLWDRHHKQITLLDNNILFDTKHFKKICNQLNKNNLSVYFEQGLDYRLLNETNIKILSKTNIIKMTFAYDGFGDHENVQNKIIQLRHYYSGYIRFYVMINFNSNIDEDYDKILFLKNIGVDIYVLMYGNDDDKSLLKNYVNTKQYFHTIDFKTYLLKKASLKQLYFYIYYDIITKKDLKKSKVNTEELEQKLLF